MKNIQIPFGTGNNQFLSSEEQLKQLPTYDATQEKPESEQTEDRILATLREAVQRLEQQTKQIPPITPA